MTDNKKVRVALTLIASVFFATSALLGRPDMNDKLVLWSLHIQRYVAVQGSNLIGIFFYYSQCILCHVMSRTPLWSGSQSQLLVKT